MEIVGQAGTGDELMLSLRQPDVAIVDIRMPPTDDEGSARRRIREKHPETAVLCSQYLESLCMELLSSAGRRLPLGIASPTSPDFVAAVKRASARAVRADPSCRSSSAAAARTTGGSLTPREARC